jgi:phosphinothricin acetyltransferase
MVARSHEEQLAWLEGHTGAYAATVLVDDAHAVAGFASLSPYRSRPAYAPTVEDSVYVHHEHRGRGFGRLLLDDLLRRARDHGFHSVIARIVGGHEASIAVHARCGFEYAGTEREVGRKQSRWLDVVLMQRML